jgi:hypothetical protein
MFAAFKMDLHSRWLADKLVETPIQLGSLIPLSSQRIAFIDVFEPD